MSAGAPPPPPYSAPSRSARRPPTPHAVSSVLARHFPGATFNGTIIINNTSTQRPNNRCNLCKKVGHIKKNCRLLKAHEAAVAAKAAAAKVAATSASVSASATSGSPVSEPVCHAAGISADPAASAATTSAEPAGRDEKDTKVM
ncbi:hypothetical protein LTR91_002929 [Friedmanniomyces endolithicus]|uniref:CCHC-type domain-containing protein n=1 Tax=Friedmanniomyces endolithicus TaxID=329885 RepID=A0AAN6KYK2_9PEZI|nr:hypothetical protein LTR57_004584 [Friedmanniomyces endolithicus]KAK1004145.1 hypothetical protein LTS01_003742 [Friedmanniomyces endolithicus]KAK1009279.1 hypothetical protein LTR91_002929 [Friedmanniomyces endolithicus]KAK1021648.1 hypothetical protein LTS16_026361 [Friedmanniomyces endolithicus]